MPGSFPAGACNSPLDIYAAAFQEREAQALGAVVSSLLSKKRDETGLTPLKKGIEELNLQCLFYCTVVQNLCSSTQTVPKPEFYAKEEALKPRIYAISELFFLVRQTGLEGCHFPIVI